MEDISESVDMMEKELSRLLEWIRSADSRLKIVLPLSTAMLGALSLLAPPASQWTVLASITTSFASLFLTLSIAFAALASFPRTAGPKGSLIFFGGIITKDLVQYNVAVREMNMDQYLDDLISVCPETPVLGRRQCPRQGNIPVYS
jgi:hypothetical protein